ncbi:hypothetical protein DFH06DRAFT_1472679 [Mycena polygramma]|nr:hypothetical protein DFH06DRAFT_1472679 [Mycena polygramma]
MHTALTDLAQDGLLGDAELLLFYGFRKPASGDLDIGIIHGHSTKNRVNVGGSHAELQANYGDAWGLFADTVIPRPVITSNSVIPRNESGVPVFPSVDLNAITPADTRFLLEEYWSHIWAFAWGAADSPPIPWEEIASNPSVYYDTVKFRLPLGLAPPQTPNTLHTTIWGEFLVRTSSLLEDSPFVFYPKVLSTSTGSTPNTGSESIPRPTEMDTDDQPNIPNADAEQALLNGEKALSDAEKGLSGKEGSAPRQNGGDNGNTAGSSSSEDDQNGAHKKSGRKRANAESKDTENRPPAAKRAKRSKNTPHPGPSANSNPEPAHEMGPRRSSRRSSAKISPPATVAKKGHVKRRIVGWVESDEEEGAFEKERDASK